METIEQRINKLLLIVGTGIAFEIVVFALHLLISNLISNPSPFILFSFFATYIVMLFFAKRVGIFNKTSLLQALLYTLLIAFLLFSFLL